MYLGQKFLELIANLIKKCWDAKAEIRPTAKELYQISREPGSEIHSQTEECKNDRENKLKNTPMKISPTLFKHIDFKDLPEPVNSSNHLLIKFIQGIL